MRTFERLGEDSRRELDGDGGPSPLGKNAEQYDIGTRVQQSSDALNGLGTAPESVGSGTGAEEAADFTADVGAVHLVDTTGAAITVVPPLATQTQVGDSFQVVDSQGNAGTNNIDVDFTGFTFHGGAGGTVTLSTNFDTARFTYAGSSAGWVRTGS